MIQQTHWQSSFFPLPNLIREAVLAMTAVVEDVYIKINTHQKWEIPLVELDQHSCSNKLSPAMTTMRYLQNKGAQWQHL